MTVVSKTTNRLTTGTSYNEAGMVVSDTKFRGMGFGYDANGRMVNGTRTPSSAIFLSVYDALGNRVAAKVNDVWQVMVYDAFGKLVAEYGEPQEVFGSRLKYVQQDWQGSVRTVSNQNGYVISRTDHTAYGETVGAGVGLRSTLQGYFDSPETRQGYGLTERDEATGLDHTWFRKHEGSAGRWTSPDPYLGSMNLGDPQSFNRYSYVQGDPVNFVDPSGLWYLCVWYAWFEVNSDGNPIRQISEPFLRCFDMGGGGGSGGYGYQPESSGGGGGDVGGLAIGAYNTINKENSACATIAKKLGLDKIVSSAKFLFPDESLMNTRLGDLGFKADDVGDLNAPLSATQQKGAIAVANFRTNTIYLFGEAFVEDSMINSDYANTRHLGRTVFHEALHLKYKGDHEKIAKKLGLNYGKNPKNQQSRDESAAEAIDAFIKNGCKK